jgi:hypothetical protein
MTDKILTNRTNNTSGENEPSEIDDEVIKQFKFIITIVFIILLFSLGYFVYNLIKCYLPKWRKNKKLQEESLQPAQIMNEPKKNEGIMIEL